MVPPNNLGPGLSDKDVNETQYRGMIGSLMYLTARRPNIQFSTCLCARYQANPKESYLMLLREFSAMSLAEAEYVAVAGCCTNILWMKSKLTDYDIIYEKVPIFYDNTSAISISNNLVLHSRTKHIDIIYHFIGDHILKGDIELHFIPTQYQRVDIFTKPLDEPTFKRLIVELDQVEFIFEEIAFTTNNEVALLYPLHPNSDYFIETLDDSKIWVSTPTRGIRGDIGYSGEIRAKGTLKKSCLPPRAYASRMIRRIDVRISDFLKLFVYASKHALKPNQTEGPPFTDHMKAICNLDVHVDPKSPKPYSQTEEVPQGKKSRAKSRLRRKQSSKHTSKSKTESSKSKTGQSEKETQSSLAKDKIPSHPSPPTPVVGEIHKELQQAPSGPTSLGATSEDGAHSQLSSGYDASADSTAEAGSELSAPNDSIPSQQDILKDKRSTFLTPDSPQDEPIIVLDESEEEEFAKDKDTHASSHDVPEDTSIPHPPSPKSAQIQELMAQPKLSKLLASNNFASCLPTKLKELPSKFIELSGEIKVLKQHIKDMKIELPGDLKEIPTKLQTFTSTISIQKQLKTLDSLPSLLNKVTETLNRFATVVENASGATTKDVPSAGQATASLAEGEKNTTKDAETNLQNELVYLLGIDVVEQYHNKKLLFDKYCDKMLKRRKSSKIINYDVITQKGPISLKVYREDETIEVFGKSQS
ncbi:hypothetical protein Tco_0520634 [Tanacetum coccineum]